jgi:hypothetical protein
MIVGRQLADATCLRVAQAYESTVGGFPVEIRSREKSGGERFAGRSWLYDLD